MTREQIEAEAIRLMPAPVTALQWRGHSLELTLSMGKPVVIVVRISTDPLLIAHEISMARETAMRTMERLI